MAAPNYNETLARENPGKTYRRTRYIGVWNPEVGTPHVDILEADAAFMEGADGKLTKTRIRESGGDAGRLVDAAEIARTIQLLNPADDTVIPGQTFTVGQLYAMLYSYARDCQHVRDSREPPLQVYGVDANGFSTGEVRYVPCNLYGGHTIPDGFVSTAPPKLPVPADGSRAQWNGTAWSIVK